HPRVIEYGLLGGAAAATLVAGLVLWAFDSRRRRRQRWRAISDSSVASATLAVGLSLALLGAGFGLWLILIGAGIAALGCGALAVALLSGVDADAQRWLSVHMLQHLMLLLAPVLLLWAAPIRLGLCALPPRGRHVLGRMLATRATRLASRPAVGFGAFAVIVLGSHASGVFEVALRHPGVHALEHAGYLAAGLLLLAPLVGSDPLPRPPGAIV